VLRPVKSAVFFKTASDEQDPLGARGPSGHNRGTESSKVIGQRLTVPASVLPPPEDDTEDDAEGDGEGGGEDEDEDEDGEGGIRNYRMGSADMDAYYGGVGAGEAGRGLGGLGGLGDGGFDASIYTIPGDQGGRPSSYRVRRAAKRHGRGGDGGGGRRPFRNRAGPLASPCSLMSPSRSSV
jgi:hypothetical protein